MKKVLSFLSLFVLLTAFTCENEPLEGEFISANPDTNPALEGTWYAVSFSAITGTSTSTNGMDVQTTSNITGLNMDYTLVFNNGVFTTSGSYDTETSATVNGMTTPPTINSLSNINGNGVYTNTATTITTDGAFFELQIDGIDDSAFGGEQTSDYTISADGQTLTLSYDDVQTVSTGGLSVNVDIVSTSVWSKIPPNNGNNPVDSDLLGTWLLTEWSGTEAIDLNEDGTESINFLDEMDCYNNETMVFNANNTGTVMNTSFADINTDLVVGTTNEYDFTIDCISEIENLDMTWSQSANDVTITESGVASTWTLNGNELSITIPEGFVAIDSADLTVTVSQDLTFVYTKQ